MLQIDYEVNARKVRAEGFRENVRAAFQSFGKSFITDLKSGRLRGNPIKRRSGNLANGWNDAFIESGNEMEERVFITGPGAAYAKMQEYGGTVRPKKGRFLWIPIAGNVTPTGVPRVTPTEAIERGGFISWKRGPVFFAKPLVKTRKGDTTHGLVPLFVLKTSVTIPSDESRRMGARSLFMAHGETLRKSILAAARGVI